MSGKVSVDARRRLVAESLRVGNPGNNARDLVGQVDPRMESQIELAVDGIQPYEHNPRRAANANFDDGGSGSHVTPAQAGVQGFEHQKTLVCPGHDGGLFRTRADTMHQRDDLDQSHLR